MEMIVAVEEMEVVRNDSGLSKKPARLTLLRFVVDLLRQAFETEMRW